MKVFALFCSIAPAAAQFGFSLSLGPAFHSFTKEVHSIFDPSPPARAPRPTHDVHTSHAQNTPEPQTPTQHAPSPTVVVAPPPVKQSSSPLPTSSFSSVSSSSQAPSPTKDPSQHEQPVSAPTSAASSKSTGGGLSKGAKLGIGLTIGLLALCGLMGAAFYSFMRDRRASDAYANWRERRRAKHRRLNSTTGSVSSFRGVEQEKATSASEYGNGTLFGRPAVATSESTQNLVEDLPEPPPAVTYQQARVVHIKRKAVPGLPPQSEPQAAPLQEPPQSYPPSQSQQPFQTRMESPSQERMPPRLQMRNQAPPHARTPAPFQRIPGPLQIRNQPPPHARMQRPRYSWNQPPFQAAIPRPLQVHNPDPPQPGMQVPRYSWVEDGH